MSDVERAAMVEKAAKPNQASLDILVRGAEKTFDNAERLFRVVQVARPAPLKRLRSLTMHALTGSGFGCQPLFPPILGIGSL
jgi:hypothetical protein